MHRCWMLMSNMVKVSNVRLEFIQIPYMNQKLRHQVVFFLPLALDDVSEINSNNRNKLHFKYFVCTESSIRHFVFITADSFCMQKSS